jgi:hypothetical protein
MSASMTLITASQVVSGVNVDMIGAGVVRVTVELNRPATPMADRVRQAGGQYLLLTYLK